MYRLLISITLFLCLAHPGKAQLGADFTADQSIGCTPLVVSFRSSLYGPAAGAGYQWDLGNGNTAATANPQAIYTQPGTYTVTLTVTVNGEKLSASHPITVFAAPSVQFGASANLVCNTPVIFTATGQAADGGSLTGWLWDFGDGSTLNGGSTLSHSFLEQGLMTVSLTVSDIHGCTASAIQPNIVQVLPSLTAAFTPSQSVLCNVSDPVQFTNTSTGPGTLSYSWDFADGTGSTQQSPAHSYAQAGDYPVKLTVNSSVGCVSTAMQATPLNVANYHTDFTLPSSICQNAALTLSDASTPTPTRTTWSVDGVAGGGFHQFYYTFFTPGQHTVTLANVYGTCPQQASHSIQVNALPPAPSFSISPQSVCGAPVTVNFADRGSPAGIANWAWNIQWLDGSHPPVPVQSTTSGAMSQLFTTNGQFQVNLQLTNAAGCTSSTTQYFTIFSPSVSIYEQAPTSASQSCNQPITKTLAWTPPAAALQNWSWDFGDGTTSTVATPTHVWTQPGYYSVTLHWTDVNGCSGTSSGINVLIARPMNLDFTATPTTVCAGTSVQFNSPSLDASGANSVQWIFGDGQAGVLPNHLYRQAGTYTVTLNATNAGGCTATVTRPQYITVLPTPGHYDGYTSTCDGNRNLVTFSYTPSGATSISWDFGDGTTQTTAGNVGQVQHSYPHTGTYYINVNATDGTCNNPNSDVVPVLLKQKPILSAASTVCSNGSLQVFLTIERNPREINSGYYDDYTPTFYYGDGTPFGGTVNFTTPYNAYNNGAFEWTLTGFQEGKSGLYVSTSSFGFDCTDVSNRIPLTIVGPAAAGLTVAGDNQCFKSPVQFSDASTVGPNNAITSWTWDFGDGITVKNGTGASVSHAYAQPGNYPARLTIQDQGGCLSSSGGGVANVQVNGPAPGFSYSPSRVLMGNTVYFYNYTNTTGAPGTTYVWDFGDGANSSLVNPTHVYPGPGTYIVTLTARGPNGNTCTLQVQQTIVVNYFNPHFQIAPLYVTGGHCPPVLAQFTNTSTNYSYVAWDFGDGVSAGNLNYPSHVYTHPGAYEVTLFVYGSGGLIAKYTDSVFVRQPSATLTAKTPAICINQSEPFQAKAKGALNFVFDYGDGSLSSGPDSGVVHLYTRSGSYSAQLVVTDTVGCSAAAGAPASVRVNPLPTVTIYPNDPHVCLGSGVQLTASGGSTYSWSPATGLDNPASSAPIASPTVNTTYQVLGTDDNGCQGQSSVALKVVFPETLGVTPDSASLCQGDTLRLHAKGTDVFEWIGDVSGLSSTTAANPLAQPAQTAHYLVVGSDGYACFSDTAAITLTVLPLPTVNGGGGLEVLIGTPVTLAATGSADIVQWEWTPATYLSCTDCAQPVCTPKKPETYQVLVTNDVGCHAKDTVAVKLLCIEANLRIPDAFSPNGDGHNDRWTILGIGEVDHLVIYDRWGEKVFERDHYYTADADAQWDGSFRGQPAPTGVYAYFLQMSCPSGGVFTRKGTVVLVR
jgi:gliding motility-associated-like protein